MIITRQPTTTRETTHCPVCGGLECLCRPRFFAGQLLTEEDLNRLEHYIIGKNKLHNRYLHGWGVACGLEVLCNPCDGFVTVKPGYALSPCGDDIVVCEDAGVNVCDLINRCRSEKDFDCDPAWPRPAASCGDQDEQWVLYICYDEKPSRGITPLRGSSGGACCSRCSGGRSSACGCGCHEKNVVAKNGCRTPQPKTPPQCEPTITCEGYTFQLRKLNPKETRDLGEMVTRVQACVVELSKIQQLVGGLPGSSHQVQDVLAIRELLMRFLDEHGLYDCKLYDRIQHSDLPDATHPIGLIQQYFRAIIVELLQACVCSALLPACPPPSEDNCVPIATLTVNCKGGGCHIVRVCNWEHRRLAVGFPTLEYWFGALLSQTTLTGFLTKLCCQPIRVPSTLVGDAQHPNSLTSNTDSTGNPSVSENSSLGGSAQDNLVNNLLDEAVANQGRVKRSSVYKQVAEIVRGLVANLFSDR